MPLSEIFVDVVGGHSVPSPDAPALVAEDVNLTYRELDHRARQWASALRDHGVESSHAVAVCLPRGAEAVCAALGVWRAGGVLLLVDPEHPPIRRAQMIDSANCRLLISGDSFGTFDVPVVSPTVLNGYQALTENFADAGDPAYIVFTSGSTGVPKAVLCEHSGLINLVDAQRDLLGLARDDRVAMIAPFTVDAFIFELALALGAGAVGCFADDQQRHPGPPISRFLHTHEITAMVATPTMLRSINPDEYPSLRLIVSAGEALDTELAGRWLSGRRLINAYGPTEATICTTMADISGAEEEIPLGSPIPNCHIEIRRTVDPGTAADVDEVGELYITGAGVARGYLNHVPNDSFTTDPRGYRTGDLAVRRPDGSMVFVGRGDHQIKLGGFRIELGEIEHHLHRHPAVQDAAVLLDSERLVAYLTSVPGLEQIPDDKELILFIEDRLPPQYAPTAYIWLPAMPMTEWGKVDTSALPAALETIRQSGTELRPPDTPTQRLLVTIVEELLNGIPVGISDDLFMLGLNSILIARLMTRVQDEYGVELEPIEVFEDPTIVGIAKRIEVHNLVTEA
jgi:amino acid adenylation domain-containing protein